MPPGTRRVLAARVAEWIALGLIPVLTAIRVQFGPTDPPRDLTGFLLKALHEWYAFSIFGLGTIGLLGKVLQEVLGAEAKGRIKAVLDTLDEACFHDVPEGERYENRVTLFKANWWTTKLKPYGRSGTVYQRGIQSLSIHDSDQDANEGVGGQAWFRNSTVAAYELPDCAVPCSNTEATCLEYARRGLLPIDKTRKVRVRSRSLLATPVRDFRGRKWGVLVLDSRKPDSFTADQEGLVRSFAGALGKMV